MEDNRVHGNKMISIGTDIIEIERVKHLLEKHGGFCRGRIFTEKEWDYCYKKLHPFPSLAVRFAAKEAVSKALGVGMGKFFKWNSTEILCDEKGMPYVVLDDLGKALLEQRKFKSVKISLSHSKEFALAVAILES